MCVMLQVRTILLSIQSLLGEPNNDSPLNTHAAELWSNQVSPTLPITDHILTMLLGRVQKVFVRKVRKRRQICVRSAGIRKNFSLLRRPAVLFNLFYFCIKFFLNEWLIRWNFPILVRVSQSWSYHLLNFVLICFDKTTLNPIKINNLKYNSFVFCFWIFGPSTR